MAEDVQLLAIGAAAVLDLVLLLAFLERPNRRYIALWMLLLNTGALLWHAGAFFHVLLGHSTGRLANEVQVAMMTLMAAGLLLMPSAFLHGSYRLRQLDIGVAPQSRRRLCALYLPLVMLVPIARRLAESPLLPFRNVLIDFEVPYVAWVSAVNVAFSVVLLRAIPRVDLPRTRQLFIAMAWTLMGITAGNLFSLYAGVRLWPAATEWLMLAVTLTPLLPMLLFAFFVLRYQFMPLVLERTLVYGAVVIGGLLLHQIATRNVASAVEQEYGVDFGILEGCVGIVLILAYQPLRKRVTESLSYLFGGSGDHRDQNRQLSVQLATRAGTSPNELFQWFVESIPATFRVRSAGGWLFDSERRVCCRAGNAAELNDSDAIALEDELSRARLTLCTTYDGPTQAALDLLQRAQALAAIRIELQDGTGLLCIGSQRLNQSLGDEELSALALLAEQLGATLQNCQLQESRAAAERRATQQEKLSTLGLLAGSIAHELKNPLSSMKTIATVLAEDLGTHSPHAEDLRMILGEIDRLAATASQLLEIASPSRPRAGGSRVQDVLAGTVRLVRHFAQQQRVALETGIGDDLPPVAADEARLREIFLNLLSNSIEACGPNGNVSIVCQRDNGCILVEVRDNGPGLAPDVSRRLFEPFVTTKDTGTGLGLYLVGCRVRELGGQVTCETAGTGTVFRVRLPTAKDEG